jgi:iron complex outermembrane receptor protein
MKKMSLPIRRGALCPAALFGVLLGTTNLFAQTLPAPTAADQAPIVLDPFTVTASADRGYRPGNSVSATRIDTPIKDLPLAINAFTEEFMHDLYTTDLADVLRFAPNVTNASADFTNGDLKFNLRGFSQFNPLRNGLTGQRVTGLSNIARVEVVKGPASVLYGNVAPGGVINYITKKPLEKPFYMIQGTVGTDSLYRVDADLTGPISKEAGLYYRLTGTWDEKERSAKPSDVRRYSFAPSVRWELFDKKVIINVDYEKADFYENPPVFTLPNVFVFGYDIPYDVGVTAPWDWTGGTPDGGYYPGLPKDFNFPANQDYRRYKNTNFVVDTTIRLPGDFTLRGAGSYSTRDAYYMVTGRGFVAGDAVTVGNPPVTDADWIPVRNPDGTIKTTSTNQILRRVRYERNYGNNTDYTLELYKEYLFGGVTWKPLLGGTYQSEVSGSIDRRLPSAQWQAPWDLTKPATWIRDRPNYTVEQLTVVARNEETTHGPDRGYYFINQLSMMDSKLNALLGIRRSTIGDTGQSQNSPLAGVLYKLTPKVAVYASYSESFEPQGALILNDQYAGEAKPTIGKGYDFGIKTELMEGRLSASLSYFNLTNTNVKHANYALDPAGSGSLVQNDIQDGDEIAKGVELDATFTFTREWTGYVSYGYLDATVDSNSERPWMVGSPLVDSAQHTGGLLTKYEFYDGRLKGFSVGVDVSFVGRKLQRQSPNALTPPARVRRADGTTYVTGGTAPAYNFYADPYSVVDLFAGYAWQSGKMRYDLSVSLKNVFDEVYQPSNLSRGDTRRLSFTLAAKF